MQADDPPYLPVGTAVSAKYKGAFCEAKVSKVVRIVKCKVTYKMGLGTGTINDEQIKGPVRIGGLVRAIHPERREYLEATITKIQDCSQYTVVFDDGDITTLRRSALCLKSGRHFNESETLDQLPLTHPEHFGNPVMVRGRGRRSRQLKEDSSEGEAEEGNEPDLEQYSVDTGKVVSIESSDKKRTKDNWFPGLIVMPSAQPTVRINLKDEFLIRSFKDGRYYTVPKKEVKEFDREKGAIVEGPMLIVAVEKAVKYLDCNELPVHWERNSLFNLQSPFSDSDENFTDSSDDEPTEEKDHFVAQLYKFMDDSGTPLNKTPTIGNKDVDLYRLFRLVYKLGGYNRVTNQNKWKSITVRLKFAQNQNTYNQVKQVYKKCLLSYESFYRTLGCTMLNPTRNAKKNRGRTLFRDKDRVTPVQSPRPEKPDDEAKKEELKKDIKKEEKRSEASDNSSDATDPSEQPGTSKEVARPKRAADGKIKKPKTAGGEKVKSLVEKFEEVAKKEDDKEDKPQQTRSQLPKKEAASPERKRESKTPLRDPPKLLKSSTKRVKDEEDKDKKRGRKRGNADEKLVVVNAESGVIEGAVAPPSVPATAPPVSSSPVSASGGGGGGGGASGSQVSGSSIASGSSVNIGDKLKVYYGPTHESKVTYEAKVLEIDKDPSGQLVYLVHYTGWNTRYDEWIAVTRIAENLSATTKAKKMKQGAAAGAKSGGGKPAAKRGRGMSITGRSTLPDAPPPRSTTPSSVTSSSSRTKSPATPASRNASRVTRQDSNRRTRRTSAQTDVSVHSESESDERSESESELSRTRSGTKSEDSAEPKTYRRKLIKTKRKKEDDDTEKEEELDRPKRLRKLKKASPDKSAPDSDEEPIVHQAKGREFDLNQIRSELKGFGKAIKVADSSEKENASSDESSAAPTDGKETASENEPEVEKEKDKAAEKDSEDIYEFKEPEPFEYESRKIEDKSGKKRLTRLYDEVEKSPKKKSPRSPAKVEPPLKVEPPEKRFRRTPAKKVEVEVGEEEEDKKEEKKVEDAFDKLVDSPSFHIGKTSEEKPAEKPAVAKVLNMDEPLSIFELSESIEENSEDRLELSDSEEQRGGEVRFTHVAPLFLTASFGKSSPSENLLIETEVFNKVEEEEEVKNSEDDEEIAASIQRVIEQTITDEDSGDLLDGEVKIETITLNRAEEEEEEAKGGEDVVEEKQVVLSKQIAAVFQETDSSLLEDLYAKPQFKSDLNDFKEIKTGTKIADTILRKLSKIGVKSVEVVEVEEEDEDKKDVVKLEVAEEAKTVEVKIEEEEEEEEEAVKEIEGFKKRKKGFVSKEYIEESDSDTDSDSEQRLVIARSDDDSQTSIPHQAEEKAEPEKVVEEERNFNFDVKVEEDAADPPPCDHPTEEVKDEEPDSHLHSMLLCEETIPGSPAPAPVEAPPPKKPTKPVLEMPFASAPSGSSSANKILQEQKPNQPSAVPMILPIDNGEASVLDNTPPTTPESTISNLSPRGEIGGLSPNTVDNESCKSLEAEQEYAASRRASSKVANYSEDDSLMNAEAQSSGRKPGRDEPPSPCKKRRRSCKGDSDAGAAPTTKRGRKPNRSRHNSDSDDTSEHSVHAGIAALETRLSRSPRPSKYNFFVELDPTLDSAARIAVLQQKLQDLRKTYADVKAELVTIERRRKKIRRREREALKAAKQEMTCT